MWFPKDSDKYFFFKIAHFFGPVSLVRENSKELRQNKKHKNRAYIETLTRYSSKPAPWEQRNSQEAAKKKRRKVELIEEEEQGKNAGMYRNGW